MFELTIALRYLIPRKRTLSTALVSLLSVGMISLVVWLVLVFLSVTSGIERGWMQKLTSLHAPIRLSPTEHYYSSYYYQADSIAAASGYSLKTIGEKAGMPASDPYSNTTDIQIPNHWPSPERHPNGQLIDPVKETFSVLGELNVPFEDYEISAALLKLSLSQPTKTAAAGATLSQMSFLLSFLDKNPRFASLTLPPTAQDLDALLKTSRDGLGRILPFAGIEEVTVNSLEMSLIPENAALTAFALPNGPNEILVPLEKEAACPPGWTKGALTRSGSHWQWRSGKEKIENPAVQLTGPLPLNVLKAIPENNVRFAVAGQLQGIAIAAEIREGATISRASPKMNFLLAPSAPPPWAIVVAGHCRLPILGPLQPVLLPKSYRDMGVRLGDRGSLSFAAHGAASAQEQRLPVQVAGFYDPGLFSMGGRCLIVPNNITRTIHAASQTFSPDGTPTNGIFVWNDSQDIGSLEKKITERLEKADLQSFWKVSTFKDFEFSKELFQQFHSDRTLLLMIAILILLVACGNIISLLVLLVNDKKREIAILQAMGASKKSIAAIFGLTGLTMGALSSLIGTAAAIFTLRHLDTLVGWLSSLQGHTAFQPAFFGESLPSDLSIDALLFIFIATPLLSLAAGLIPALRASRICPAAALRQE